jgi:penicillin-binding protein 2
MMRSFLFLRPLVFILSLCLASSSFGAVRKRSTSPIKKASASRTKTFSKKSGIRAKSSRKSRIRRVRYGNNRFVAGGPWLEPTFADSTLGDNVDGEDLTVRRAAVEALGPYNGSVVVADPQTGRLLTVVNQKLAFKQGFQPCSTIKIVSAIAGLNEGLIDRDKNVRLYGRVSMNLTDALAHSNNPYFANIGVKLGYDKINYYARLLGLGEKAGLNIEEEEAGTLPDGPPKNGGMGMMTSFGEGIKLTPLQLTSMLSAVANWGTVHYLQYPKSQEESE